MLYDWIRNMTFANPLVFGLFIVPLAMIWWYGKKHDRNQSTVTVSSTGPFRVASYKNYLRHVPFALRLLAITALIIALGRPQKRNDQSHTEGEGIDIILCMDVSGSMGARDIPPTRMEVAKEVAEEFVRSRPVDRIGLVIFSGESFSPTPLTTDRETLITQIRTLESRRYLRDGTVIGEGLATAVDRLSKSQAKSKVIILLTDGKEDPPETRLIDPLTALEIAKARGVRVYAIGMGVRPSTIVEITDNGEQKQTGAVDFLDEELLTKIAAETGGQFYRAVDKEALKTIYKRIDALEKSKVDVVSYKRFEELFVPFILAALGLLMLEMILRLLVLRKFP